MAPSSQIERLQEVINSAVGGTVKASSDGTTHDIFPIAVDPREGAALSDWVAKERAASTIEIGLGYGIATLFVLRGLLTGGSSHIRHLAIDPNQTQRFSSIALQLVDEAGLSDRLDFRGDRSEFVLPRLLADGRRFDFAVVDGNHRFDWVFVDIVFLGKLVRGGGVLFLDDYQLPSVRKAVAFCTSNLGWIIEEEGAAGPKHRWVVVRTPAQGTTTRVGLLRRLLARPGRSASLQTPGRPHLRAEVWRWAS